MKKTLTFMLAIAITLSLSGCNNKLENTNLTQTEQAPETSEITTTPIVTTAPAATAITETTSSETIPPKAVIKPTPPPKELADYFDEYGLVTEKGIEQIKSITKTAEENKVESYIHPCPGLFDFNMDGYPEVYIVEATGNRGLVNCSIYDWNGNKTGSFKGYCRDGYTCFSQNEDKVYVHNYYESFDGSVYQRYEDVLEITKTGSGFETKSLIESVGSAIPGTKLGHNYKENGNHTSGEIFNKVYNNFNFIYMQEYESYGIFCREANEASFCCLDSGISDIENGSVTTAEIYNSYVVLKRMATEFLNAEPWVFAFRDYDGDGKFEAFFSPNEALNSKLYFVNENGISEIESDYIGYHYSAFDGVFMVQDQSNCRPCVMFSVSDGKPYELNISNAGMLFERYSEMNGTYTITCSQYDSTGTKEYPTAYGTHTWTPYWFYRDVDESGNLVFREYGGIKISKEDLSGYNFNEVWKLIADDGGEICDIYYRGNNLVNINYQMPEPGTEGVYWNKYYTVYFLPGFPKYTPMIVDSGFGIYRPALVPEAAVYPQIPE